MEELGEEAEEAAEEEEVLALRPRPKPRFSAA